MKRDIYWKIWPTLTFLVVVGLGYGARQAIGTVYGQAEAVQLLEALSRAGLYLGSAVTTASVTSLALMLTLIGMMRRADSHFDEATYHRVMLIAGLSAAALMSSLLVLLAFVFPMGEFEALPDGWYQALYDILFFASVLMVALLATTVTVTYLTVRRVIAQITPGDAV